MSPESAGSSARPSEVEVVDPLALADWDASVSALPGSGIFHSRAWAGVLRDSYGYAPLYLKKSAGGRMVAALPLFEVASWLSGRRGVSLPFTDAVEPLGEPATAGPELFAAAQHLARSRGWKYLEIRGGRPGVGQATPSTCFFNHRLDLQLGEAAVFAQFEESVQRAIRKAERAGLEVEFSRSADAVKSFYELLCQTRRRHGVPPQPYRFFENIHRQVLATGQGWVVLARHQGKPVAGAVYFHFGTEAVYKYGASDTSFQQFRANNLVMWKAIQHYAGERFVTLDFGRTSFGNEGLRRFKLGWGARERVAEYFRYDCRANRFVTVPDQSSGWHSRVFNALPTWVSRPIGELLYPHMG